MSDRRMSDDEQRAMFEAAAAAERDDPQPEDQPPDLSKMANDMMLATVMVYELDLPQARATLMYLIGKGGMQGVREAMDCVTHPDTGAHPLT